MRLDPRKILPHQNLVFRLFRGETVEHFSGAPHAVALAEPRKRHAERIEFVLPERTFDAAVVPFPVEYGHRFVRIISPLETGEAAHERLETGGVIRRNVAFAHQREISVQHRQARFSALRVVIGENLVAVAERRFAGIGVRHRKTEHLHRQRHFRLCVTPVIAGVVDSDLSEIDALGSVCRRLHPNPERLTGAGGDVAPVRFRLRRQRIRPKRRRADFIGRSFHRHITDAQNIERDARQFRAGLRLDKRAERDFDFLERLLRSYHELHGLGLVRRRADAETPAFFRRRLAPARNLASARSAPEGDAVPRAGQQFAVVLVEKPMGFHFAEKLSAFHFVISGRAAESGRSALEGDFRFIAVDLNPGLPAAVAENPDEHVLGSCKRGWKLELEASDRVDFPEILPFAAFAGAHLGDRRAGSDPSAL